MFLCLCLGTVSCSKCLKSNLLYYLFQWGNTCVVFYFSRLKTLWHLCLTSSCHDNAELSGGVLLLLSRRSIMRWMWERFIGGDETTEWQFTSDTPVVCTHSCQSWTAPSWLSLERQLRSIEVPDRRDKSRKHRRYVAKLETKSIKRKRERRQSSHKHMLVKQILCLWVSARARSPHSLWIWVSSHQASRWGHCSAMRLHNISSPWASVCAWVCVHVCVYVRVAVCNFAAHSYLCKHKHMFFSKSPPLSLLTVSPIYSFKLKKLLSSSLRLPRSSEMWQA